ncbi:MAG: PQQ-dependent sugar dehydrogenase, partial [Chloroflexota bacterium]
MSGMISTGNNEQGLLGLALDPAFSRNGRLYVGYTAAGSASAAGVGDNSVARIVVSPDDPDRAAIDTLEVLLAVEDPYGNHNGGQVAFGPDGYLYAGLGDGGAGGDPENHAQDPGSLLGSMLRLDVSGSAGYSIPGDNPFADGQGGRPEIWAYGLRNPWRFSFDRETGDLWIGDVGQNWIEEIDMIPAGSRGGANFGWRVMEGTSCYEDDECDPSSFVPPVAQYTHDEGCSVTGGYVYRGSDMPGLGGVYLCGEICTGAGWGLGRDAAGSWVRSAPVETGLNISSFGEDADGNLYLLSFDGGVYRLGAAQ